MPVVVTSAPSVVAPEMLKLDNAVVCPMPANNSTAPFAMVNDWAPAALAFTAPWIFRPPVLLHVLLPSSVTAPLSVAMLLLELVIAPPLLMPLPVTLRALEIERPFRSNSAPEATLAAAVPRPALWPNLTLPVLIWVPPLKVF